VWPDKNPRTVPLQDVAPHVAEDRCPLRVPEDVGCPQDAHQGQQVLLLPSSHRQLIQLVQDILPSSLRTHMPRESAGMCTFIYYPLFNFLYSE